MNCQILAKKCLHNLLTSSKKINVVIVYVNSTLASATLGSKKAIEPSQFRGAEKEPLFRSLTSSLSLARHRKLHTNTNIFTSN